MKSSCALIFVLAVSGCATTTAPNIPLDQSKVRLLFEYPPANYQVIGMRGFYIYKPGWSAPDLDDIWPSVVEGVTKERGNACILRSERIGQFDRSLSVTCEIINVEYGRNKLPQAVDGTISGVSGESVETGNNVISNKNVNSSERLEELSERRKQGDISEEEVQADTMVGRWCDKQIPTMPQYNGILAIVITDDGAVELRVRWGDGSSVVTKLSEQAGGIYAVVGSDSGDKYRIVSADGNLQLLDNDGHIRIATRLDNTPQPGDCGI